MNATFEQEAVKAVCSVNGLVCFWDFQEPAGENRIAKGACSYALREGGEPVPRAEEGIFGPYSADFQGKQWFEMSPDECPALNFSGKDVELTVMAWIKWRSSETTGCQAVAGIWNETMKKRQYCLFLDLRIWDSKHQVCGHVSAEGGPTPGFRYCMTSAIGSTRVDDAWHLATFTYDGEHAKVYLDDQLDQRDQYNPFYYPDGLYDGGSERADFTVGAVDRSNEIGNFYNGLLGGLAVFNRALTAAEIARLHEKTLSSRRAAGDQTVR